MMDIGVITPMESHYAQSTKKPPRPSPPPRLLRTQAAADMLGISDAYVRRLIAGGELQSVNIGRRILVPIEAVHAYADKLTAA